MLFGFIGLLSACDKISTQDVIFRTEKSEYLWLIILPSYQLNKEVCLSIPISKYTDMNSFALEAPIPNSRYCHKESLSPFPWSWLRIIDIDYFCIEANSYCILFLAMPSCSTPLCNKWVPLLSCTLCNASTVGFIHLASYFILKYDTSIGGVFMSL